ncbi:MAG: Hsp70 family protein [Candidatus Paceibacterota bacterium]|jgi:hypothetical chaperone protein
MSITFGLDFGTTNSILAIAQDGNVEIVDIDPTSSSRESLKSVLFFDEENSISIGQDAIDQYLDYGGTYGRFMQSIKAFLPDRSFVETYVFGKRYQIEDLIALILKAVKHRGELHAGHVVDTVIIGRPVVFSEDKELDLLAEERLRDAVLRSGFTNVHFMYEPIAATMAHESHLREGEEKLVLMGDFGGGTSDFVVMRLRGGKHDPNENRKSDILATGGVYVAGDALDASIMWEKLAKHFGRGVRTLNPMPGGQILDFPSWIPHTLCQWHRIPLLRDRKTLQFMRSLPGVGVEDQRALENLRTLVVENLGYKLFRVIEKAKCELSNESSSVIDFCERGIEIHETITREEFETLAEDKFQKIEECVDDVLSRSGVSASDIDSVLLTGGSSFIPRIRKIFSSRFGEEKLLSIDAFTSVAYGLGLSASRY